MKTLLRSTLLLTVLFILVVACNSASAGGNVKNEFLGEYPSLLKNYLAKMDKMDADIKAKKSSRDMDALLKLAKEKKELEKEFKTKVDDYSKSFKYPKTIQIQPLEGSPVKINSVKVKSATSDALGFGLDVTLNNDIKNEYGGFERILIIYFKAVDGKGNVIAKSYTNASKTNIDLKAGTALDMSIGWNNERAQNFEGFAKLIQISEAEYNKNK